MFDDILKSDKKFKKQLTLNNNKFRGKLAEDSYTLSAQIQGKEVQRTGRGSDFKERKADMFTGRKGPWRHVEVKSSPTAPLSPITKKIKEKIEYSS